MTESDATILLKVAGKDVNDWGPHSRRVRIVTTEHFDPQDLLDDEHISYILEAVSIKPPSESTE
ncbi:MAG: hypothetical protein AAB483_03950 [Patescibacteria group bacterium]